MQDDRVVGRALHGVSWPRALEMRAAQSGNVARCRPKARAGLVPSSAGQGRCYPRQPVRTPWDRSPSSEIGADQLIRAFAAARIHLGGGRVDQLAICIEGAEQAVLVGPRIGLD